MKCVSFATATLLLAALATFAEQPANKPMVSGLNNPTSVAVLKGKTYVAVAGEIGKDGDGAIMLVEGDKAKVFVGGLHDPRGLTSYQNFLFVADKNRVLRVDAKGKAEPYLSENEFPTPPVNLYDLVVETENGPSVGSVYVCDAGSVSGKGWAIYKISQGKGAQKKQVATITEQKRWPQMQRPGGIVLDGKNHLLVMDAATGTLYRVTLNGGATEKVADGLGSGNGLAWDVHGRLFISDAKGGKVYVIGRAGQNPVMMAQGFQSPGDLCVNGPAKLVLVTDSKAGTVTALPAQTPGAEVDETPLPLQTVVSFPNLNWTGFTANPASGKKSSLRPIVLTHAGDGSNRVFVALQQGIIHVFPNDQKATQTRVFLDIQKKVVFNIGQNEEGFLGLAFHPKYKTNGEFFAFYTLKRGAKDHTNIVSRFRVSKDDPNKADPAFEEELMRFDHKNFNHDGGTICFGPDGYLYITTGDGGAADDPYKNGQNLNVLLAKVLRIDVDHKEDGKNYAIPKDNPFVGRKDARPEVWAYGLRNLWRMAFDRKTGVLWAGEVGQNQFEEINIIVKGGNYGWSIREGFHPFSAQGVAPRPNIIEPIWEFHHSLGLCIIGGNVYRGPRLPELDGAYIYSDFQNGKLWALRYDDKAKRVIANQAIRTPGALEILSFGEDEAGEVYTLATSSTGKGIYHFQRTK